VCSVVYHCDSLSDRTRILYNWNKVERHNPVLCRLLKLWSLRFVFGLTMLYCSISATVPHCFSMNNGVDYFQPVTRHTRSTVIITFISKSVICFSTPLPAFYSSTLLHQRFLFNRLYFLYLIIFLLNLFLIHLFFFTIFSPSLSS
jgi:hypothetical protein